MTIVSRVTRHVLIGNGSTIGFATAIQVSKPTDIRVSIEHDGVLRELQFGVDYDVHIQPSGYTTVTLEQAPAFGDIVTIWRTTAATQEANFAENARLRAETLEHGLDKLTMLVQEDRDELLRAVKIPRHTYIAEGVEIEHPRPGKLLRAREDGLGWDHVDPAVIDPNVVTLPLSVSQGGTGATTPDGARSALGIGNTELTWTAKQTFPPNTEIKDAVGTAVLGLVSNNTSLSSVARIRAGTKNDAGANITVGQLTIGAGSRAPGAENGWATLVTRRSGSLTEELLVEGGFVIGAATGGPKGVGTVNATEYYKNGVALNTVRSYYKDFTVDTDPPSEYYLGVASEDTEPIAVEFFLVPWGNANDIGNGYSAGMRAACWGGNGHGVEIGPGYARLFIAGELKMRNRNTNVVVNVSSIYWKLRMIVTFAGQPQLVS